MNKKLALTITAVVAGSSGLFAVANTNIAWGTTFSGSDARFYNSSGVLFGTPGADGLASVGFFNGAATWDNWVSIGDSLFGGGGLEGLISTTSLVDTDATVGALGTVPMIAVFDGITDPGDIAAFSGGYLLYTDSNWQGIPAGIAPPGVPPTLNILTDQPDTIMFGQVVPGGAFDDTGFGIQTVVPEPSTYAALAGLIALAVVAIRRRK
jgi:hypothetical protein